MIDSRAFSGCFNLTAVYFAGLCPQIISSDAFENTHPDFLLYPLDIANGPYYEAPPPWNNFPLPRRHH